MTDQTTPTPDATGYPLGATLSDALRDIANDGRIVRGWDLEALAARADDYQAMVAGIEDEPADITPEQAALLDAVRDVALSTDAMAGEYAGKQLVRLAAAAFGYPLPEPVQREGGVAGFLFGRPIVPNPQAPVGTAPVDHLARQERARGGAVDPKRLALVDSREQGTEALVPAHEPWPFGPGTVVRDEDGAEAEWLDAAPEDTVVVDAEGTEWTRSATAWYFVGARTTSLGLARRGPLTVVSVGKEATRD